MILESSKTCQEVKAFQLLLMDISGSHNPCEISELSEISIFSQNYVLWIISLNENFLLKDFMYFRFIFSIFQDLSSNWIKDSISISSSPWKKLCQTSVWNLHISWIHITMKLISLRIIIGWNILTYEILLKIIISLSFLWIS